MNKAKLITTVALIGATAGLMGGCDQAEKIKDAQSDLCCTEFTVGADLTNVDFGGSIEYNAFAQASADLAGSASAVVTDLTNACRTIAVEMGAAEDSVDAATPAARLTAWCNLAVTQIKAEITAKGSLSVVAQPPSCEFSASAQANCEAKCTADVSCEAELGDISVRCDPGEISGKCSGECQGSCEGSANLAVACEGECSGTCSGTCGGTCNGKCNGTCATMGANGECAGMCQGTCEGSCTGSCQGECRGSCKVDANAMVQCSGSCTGSCMGTVTAPKCKGELKPPSAKCQGSAECSGSCKASASAKAECKPGSVEVIFDGTVDAKVDAALATLKLQLPIIAAIAKARGQVLLDNLNAVITISGNLSGGDLSVKATACLIPIATTLAEAVANIDASVKATASISTEVGL